MRELLDARRHDLAAVITAEHGKVLADAAGEVARGLENIEFGGDTRKKPCCAPWCSAAA